MISSTIRLTENLTILRELSNECLNLLKAGSTGSTTDRILRIEERINELSELLRKISYDWGQVPGEWAQEIKEWNELMDLRKQINKGI